MTMIVRRRISEEPHDFPFFSGKRALDWMQRRQMDSSPKILCVGLMCLDIINHVDHYPEEDEDIRAEKQTWQSGGNCTNTSKVLALLGRQCEFLSSLGSGRETE